jgi:hypothetical protein
MGNISIALRLTTNGHVSASAPESLFSRGLTEAFPAKNRKHIKRCERIKEDILTRMSSMEIKIIANV